MKLKTSLWGIHHTRHPFIFHIIVTSYHHLHIITGSRTNLTRAIALLVTQSTHTTYPIRNILHHHGENTDQSI